MAPLHLIPLLEIYCRPDLKDRVHAVQNPSALDDLLRWAYIDYPDNEVVARITDKGMCFVDAVMSVTEPVQTWAITKEKM